VSLAVVIGSGAREHALAVGLAREADVLATPGSDGIAAHGIPCTSASPVDLDGDLFVIGPEIPLVAGLADTLRAQGKSVLGPGANGARLEGSKAHMKELLAAANVPTAGFASSSDVTEALALLSKMRPPYVIKTDGLAAGKGVLVTSSLAEAEKDVREKLSGAAFGDAGTTVVIEEYLDGEECSLLCLVDGERAVPLVPAQDFKRVGTGNTGANTGGMGAFAPLASMSPGLVEHVMAMVVEPTLRELRRRGVEYRGVLYAGLMLGPDGPQLVEFNVRFGDPETQVVVPLVERGLYDALLGAANGELRGPPSFAGGAAVTVVLAAAGYPQAPRTGERIDGLDASGQAAEEVEGVTVYHAGTRKGDDGEFSTAGGRVLSVTGTGPDVATARRRAYEAASTISFPGMVMRTDIAARHSGGER
jgi:phosphoribosylamine--glycine ligase